VGDVVNFKQKKRDMRLALKVKDSFTTIQVNGSTLSQDEYRDYVMLLLADMILYVIKSGWYANPVQAIKNGIDIIAKKFG
jgi:hypothetical protein